MKFSLLSILVLSSTHSFSSELPRLTNAKYNKCGTISIDLPYGRTTSTTYDVRKFTPAGEIRGLELVVKIPKNFNISESSQEVNERFSMITEQLKNNQKVCITGLLYEVESNDDVTEYIVPMTYKEN